MKAIPFEQSGQFFVKKPEAPTTSWWADSPRQNFMARCQQERIRMQGSRRADNGLTAKSVGNAMEQQRTRAGRESQ